MYPNLSSRLRSGWRPFDIISLELSGSKEVAHVYQQGVRNLVAQGRTAGG